MQKSSFLLLFTDKTMGSSFSSRKYKCTLNFRQHLCTLLLLSGSLQIPWVAVQGGGMSKSINGDIHFRDLVCCSATFDFLLINFSMIFCWSPTLFTQILPTGSQRVSQFQRHSHREFCLLSGISREVLARSRVGGNMIFICVQYSVFQVMADRRHQFQDHEILQVPHYHLS